MINSAEMIYRNVDDILEIGENLQIQRKAKGLSQEELGQMMDLKSTTISRYERGLCEMGTTVLVQLLEALDVPPEDILPKRLQKARSSSAKKRRFIRLIESMTESDLDLIMPLVERLISGK